MKKAITRLTTNVRDAFKIESLENRVLLSADPLLAPVALLMLNNQQSSHAQSLSSAYHALQSLTTQAVTSSPVSGSTYSNTNYAVDQQHQSVLSSALTVAPGTVFSGSGNLNLSLTNDGTVGGSLSPDVVTTATYSQASTAQLTIQLGGTTPGTTAGNYSQVNTTGGATLNGTLAISLVNGFKPTDGQVFTIMTYGSAQGQFSNITGLLDTADGLYFTVTQGAHALTLTATPLTSAVAAAFANLPVSMTSPNNLLIGGADQGSVINVGTAGASAALTIGSNVLIDNPLLGGETHLNQSLDLTGDSSLVINGSGHTTTVSANQSVGGTININDSIAVELPPTLTLTAGTSGTGDITLGGSTADNVFSNATGQDLTLAAPGNVTFDSTLGTSGSEGYTTYLLNNLTIGSSSNPVNSVTFDGNVNLTGNLVIYSKGAVTFDGAVNLGGALTIVDTALSTVQFGAGLSLVGNLSISGAQSTSFSAAVSIGGGGNVSIQSNQMTFDESSSGSFVGTGSMTLEPTTASDNIIIANPIIFTAGSGGGPLILQNSDIASWGDTFTSITIGYETSGHANSGLGSVFIGGTANNGNSSLATFNDNVAIYGSTITVEPFSASSISTFYVNGNIDLDASSNIVIGNLVTAQTVTINPTTLATVTTNDNIALYSAGGSISEASVASYTSGTLVSADLNATAATGMSLPDIAVSTLTAVNTGATGNIVISQIAVGSNADQAAAGGNLSVTDIAQTNAGGIGNINLTTLNGTMTVVNTGAGVTTLGSGGIALTVDGTSQTLQVNDVISGLGGNINLIASGAIATTAAISSTGGQINLTSNTATITTGATISSTSGPIALLADDADTVGALISTTGGSINVTSQTDSVYINANLVSAGGTIDVTAQNNITMTSGTVVSALDVANNGIIDFIAGNSLALSTIEAGGTISLTATAGSISDVINNPATFNVDGATTGNAQLTMVAALGIGTMATPIETQVAGITLTNTGSGNVVVTNSVAITVNAATLNGSTGVTEIVATSGALQVNGAIASTAIVGTLGTAGQTGNILLQTISGDIDELSTGSISTLNGAISLNASGNIAQQDGISSGSGSIDLAAGGNITMSSGKTTQSSSGGAIRLEAGNSIALADISTSANVSLIADSGNITNANSTNLNVSASGLLLNAATGIGLTTSELNLDVSTVSGAAAAGGIYLNNDKNLTVGDVSDSVNRVAAGSDTTTLVSDSTQSDLASLANGNIVLQVNSGSLTLADGANSSGIAINANGTGNILLQTLTSGDIISNTSANIQSGSGDISVLAVGNLAQNANITTGSSGTIDVVGSIAVTMAAGTEDQSTSGAVRVRANNGNLALSNLSASTTGGNVSVYASGTITNNNGSALNINANELRIDAGTGIGLSSDALALNVNLLTAQAGSGGMYFNNDKSISIGDVSVVVSRIKSSGGTSLPSISDLTQSDLTTTANGNIVLQVQGGDITLNDGTGTDTHQAILANGSGNVLLQTTTSGDIISNTNANINSGTGNISLLAAGNVTQNANIITTSAGTVDILAGGGTISMTAGTVDQSGTGNIRLEASDNVLLSEVNTGGNVSIYADTDSGNISNNNSTNINVHAAGLLLDADGAIGADNDALALDVATVSAADNSGIYLSNDKAIAVDSVTVNVNRVGTDATTSATTDSAQAGLSTSNDGNIILITTGTVLAPANIVINNGANTGTAISANGTGNILLQTVTGGDIDINAGIVSSGSSVGNGMGYISLIAADNVNQNGTTNIQSGGGSIDVVAGDGSVTMNPGSTIQTTAGIRLDASDSLAISNLVSDAQVSLIATGGDISNNSNSTTDSGINVSAVSLLLTAGTTIGSSSSALSLDVGTFSALDASGIYLSNDKSVVIDDVSSGMQQVNADGTLAANVSISQEDLTSSNNGDIVLQVLGTLTLNGGTVTPTVAVSANGSGNILLQTLTSGDIDQNALISSGSGDISVLSAGNVAQGANVTTGGTGTIDMSAGNTVGNTVSNIAMTAGTADLAGSGAIRLEAANTIALSEVSSTGNVSLVANNGSISNNNGSSVNVHAAGVRLSAADGEIGTDSTALALDVTNLSAADASGIYLNNDQATSVNAVGVSVNRVGSNGATTAKVDAAQSDVTTTDNGNIVITTTAGNLTVNDSLNGNGLSANGSGNVLLQTQAGDIDLNAGMLTGSGDISLLASANVNQNQYGDISSASGTLDIQANAGSISMNAASSDASTSGDIRLEAADNLALGSISTSANVSLIASAGNISNNGSTMNVSSDGLRLMAGDAIGTGVDPLLLNLDTIAAMTGSGAMYLSNDQAMTVGSVAAAVSRIGSDGAVTSSISDSALTGLTTTANGNIVLQNTGGTITVADAVNANGSGNILLQTVTSGDITQNAAVQSGSGNISILSAANVNQNADISTGSGISTDGTIDIHAAGGSIVMATGTTTSSTGDQRLKASTDIDLTSITSSGNVSLIADTGNINNDNGSSLNVTAAGLRLDAGDGIGASNNALATDVTTVSAVAQAGGITIHNTGAITVGDVAVSINRVQSDASTALVTDATQSDLTTGSNGAISLIAQTGDITLTDGVNANDLAISANGSGTVTLHAVSGDIDLNNNAGIASGSGTISLTASGAIVQDSGATIGTAGSGTVALSTGSGDIDLNAAISSTSGTIDLNANGNVNQYANATISDTSGTITLAATTGDIGLGALISSGSGNIGITGQTGVTQNGAAAISTGSSGTVSITATTDDMDLNAAILSSSGAIDIVAAGNVNQNTGATITSGGNSGSGSGSVTITAGDNYTQGTGAAIVNGDSDVTLSSTTGAIALSSDVTSDGIIAITGATGITQNTDAAISTTGSSTVTLSTGSGDIDLNAGISGATGVISITADGNINQYANATLSDTSGNIALAATTGDISLGATITSGSGNIGITAETGVTQNGAAAIATASSGTVSITATTDDMDLSAGISSSSGVISLIAAGNVVQNSGATITSGSGNISSQAGDSITQDTGAAITSTSGNISLSTTTGAIALSSDVTSSGSGTGGNISITAANGLTQHSGAAIGTDGSTSTVTLSTAAGDIDLNAAISSVDGAIGITANGNINQYANATLSDTSGNIALHATTGDIGLGATTTSSSGNIDVAAETGVIQNTTAAINTGGTGTITINTVSGDVALGSDVGSSAGFISITADDNLTQNIGAVISSDSGNITLGTTLGAINLDANVTSTSGNISATAANSLTQAATAAISSSGTVTLSTASGDIDLSADVTSSSDISITAAGNVLQNSGAVISTVGSSTVTISAVSGDVTLNAATGSVDGAIGITADDSINQNANATISTDSGNVTLSATTGDIALGATTTSSSGDINVAAETGVTQNTTAAINTASTGTITIDTVTGDIALGSDVGSSAGFISITADGSLTQNIGAVISSDSGNVTLRTTTGAMNLDANVTSSSGNISATAANSLTQAATAAISSSGTVTLSTGSGDIDLSADVTSSSDISITAAGNVVQNSGAAISTVGSSTVTMSAVGGDVDLNAATSSASGAIGITADGSLNQNTDATIRDTSGNVTLTATTGAIKLGAATTSTSGDISANASTSLTQTTGAAIATGGTVTLSTASAAIGLGSDVTGSTISINAATGITQSAAAALAATGNIVLNSHNGSTSLAADIGNTTGDISILSSGNLTQNTGANISSGSGTIDVLAGGNVTMGAGTLDHSNSGAVRIDASGNVALGEISTSANVGVIAGGSISNANGSTLNISAAGARLTAGSGNINTSAIGTGSDAIALDVNTVTAAAGSGGIFLTNDQSITVGGVAESVNRVSNNAGSTSVVADGTQSGLSTSNNGSIVLVNSVGNLTLTNSVSANGSGNVLLNSAAGDVDMNNTVTSGTGNISVLAAGNVNQSANISNSGSGTIDVLAGGNISMATGTADQSSSAIRLDAGDSIGVSTISTAGNASLIANTGSIDDVNNSSGTNISANGVLLHAANAIGATGDALTLSATDVTAAAGAGGITLISAGSISVAPVSVTVNRVGSKATTTSVSDAVQSGLVTGSGSNGSISLIANAGDITLMGSGVTGSNTISADGSGTINVQAASSTGNINVDGNISSGSGTITVVAGNDVVLYNSSTEQTAQLVTGGSGTVHVLATNGSIITGGSLSTAPGSTVQTTNLVSDSLTLAVPLTGTGQLLNIAPDTVPSGSTPVAVDVGGVPDSSALTLDQTLLGQIGSGFSTVQIGSTMANQVINVSGTDSSGNPSANVFVNPLTLLASGAGSTVAISGALTATSLVDQGSGTGTTLTNATVSMNGDVQINDNVINSGNNTITAGTTGSGNLVVAGNITGAGSNSLTLAAQGGDVTVTGNVANLGQLNVTNATNVTFGAATSIVGNVTIHATGVVTFTGPLTIAAGGTLTIDGASGVVFSSSANLTAAGNVTIAANAINFNGGAKSVTGSGVLTLTGTSIGTNITLGGSGSTSGAVNIGQADLSAINAGFSQIVIGGVNSSTGHASTSDGSVTLAGTTDLSSAAGPIAIYGSSISVAPAGSGVNISGPLTLDAVNNITLGSNLSAISSASVNITSATGAITMGAGTQIASNGGNVSVASAGTAQNLSIAVIDTRQTGSESGGIVSLQSSSGAVLDANAGSNVNVYGDVVSVYGYGALASSSTAALDAIKIKAPVVSVNAPNGVVTDDGGYDGRTNYDVLNDGTLYQEAIVVGPVTRVSGNAATIAAGGASALAAAGVGASNVDAVAADLMTAVSHEMLMSTADSSLANLTTSDSDATLTVDADASDHALAQSLQQSSVLGSSSSQPYASGLSAYSKGDVEYWTEAVTI